MFVTPAFHYFVIVRATQTRLSEFQAFNWAWIDASRTVASILRLPANIEDVRVGTAGAIHYRKWGIVRHCITLADLEMLRSVRGLHSSILVSNGETVHHCENYRCEADHPVLHLTSAETTDVVTLREVSLRHFDAWLDSTFAALIAKGEVSENDALLLHRPPADDRGEIASADISAADISDMVNRYALAAVRLEQPAAASPSTLGPAFYAIKRFRAEQWGERLQYRPGSTELLIAVEGIDKSLPAVLPGQLRPNFSDAGALTYKAIVANAPIDPLDDETTARQLAGTVDPDAVYLCRERRSELGAFGTWIALESASQFIPTIVCPNPGAALRAPLARYGDTLRHRRNLDDASLNESARDIGTRLARSLPIEVVEEISSVSGTVKFLSDEPFELLQINGRPLPLHAAVVRVPVTPGVFAEVDRALPLPFNMTPRDFEEILVLRGTRPFDPVHDVLKVFCDGLSARLPSINVRIVDVVSVQDIEDALSAFTGVFAIFDGHGLHGSRAPGMLYLGSREFHVSEVASRLPPIVFLAACDTHPLDRHQDTTAAAIIFGGTRTVLGTLAPVGAVQSASLCATVIGSLFGTVPVYRAPVRWSELFTAAQRLEHVRLSLYKLVKRDALRLTSSDVDAVNEVTHKAVFTYQRDWLDLTWNEISRRATIPIGEVLRAWETYCYTSDALLHCQLGGADRIILAPSDDFYEVSARQHGFDPLPEGSWYNPPPSTARRARQR